MSDTSMIDRVAVAISGAPFPTERSRQKARAAIEAMRQSTQAMEDAAYEAVALDDRWNIEDAVDWHKSYAAALDAALSEGTSHE